MPVFDITVVTTIMRLQSYRRAGVSHSVYACSSDEEDTAKEPPVATPIVAQTRSDDDDDDDDDQVAREQTSSRVDTAAKKRPSGERRHQALFTPSCVTKEVVLAHAKSVTRTHSGDVTQNTFCGNVLCETGRRLQAHMQRATNVALRDARLHTVQSYHIRGKQQVAAGVATDALTGLQLQGTAFALELRYAAQERCRTLYFAKERAVHTVVSWLRSYLFDSWIRERCARMQCDADSLHKHPQLIMDMCFDFVQCVRQALYTLDISTGTTKREQLFVTGSGDMDTLVYYTPLTDRRVHQGALGKLSLVIFPDRPNAKRKYGQRNAAQTAAAADVLATL